MPQQNPQYEKYMLRALELAWQGLYSTEPNPRVGCVIVNNDQVVGEGAHLKAGEPHAEIHALRAAGDQAEGATAFVTLEPCSHTGRTGPCADALIEAGVAEVVIAMRDPNPKVAGQGIVKLEAAGIRVISGICEAESRDLNPGFIKRMETGLPFVRIKLGASLDGKIAMASGESQWITSPEARADVQKWRARSSAVLTGIETTLADDPSLNVRDPRIETLGRQPWRVVLDSQSRCPDKAKLTQLDAQYLILSTQAPKSDHHIQLTANSAGKVDLQAALYLLAERECNEILIEAGATLSGALLEAGLVDELLIYLAPKLLGSDARSLVALPAIHVLADHIPLMFVGSDMLGPDLRIIARVDHDRK